MRAGLHYRQYQGNGFQESSVFKPHPDKRSPLPVLPQFSLSCISVESEKFSLLKINLFHCLCFLWRLFTLILEVIIKHEGRNRDHSNMGAFIINFQKVR